MGPRIFVQPWLVVGFPPFGGDSALLERNDEFISPGSAASGLARTSLNLLFATIHDSPGRGVRPKGLLKSAKVRRHSHGLKLPAREHTIYPDHLPTLEPLISWKLGRFFQLEGNVRLGHEHNKEPFSRYPLRKAPLAQPHPAVLLCLVRGLQVGVGFLEL